MKKFVLFVLTLFILNLNAYSNEITKCIKKSDFELHSTVSLYAINPKNDKVIYKKNEHKLLNPASVLKVLTFGSAYKVLGSDYRFETGLYKDSKDNIYIN